MRPWSILQLSACLAVLGLCGFASPAQAQTQPPPGYQAPPAGPAEQGPPPGYQAPPPGYSPPPGYQPPPGYGQPQPQPYYPPGYGYGQPAPYPPPMYPPPPPPRLERHGLILGIGVGFGGVTAKNCPNCGGGFAGEFHLGAMITPRFGLMYDVSTVVHPVDSLGTDLTNTTHTLAGQLWLTNLFWVKGGFGLGQIELNDGTFNGQTASAFLVAAGIEVVQSTWFALDVQGRLTYAAYDGGGATNGLVLLGFNWY
jgi:hypothetical protein